MAPDQERRLAEALRRCFRPEGGVPPEVDAAILGAARERLGGRAVRRPGAVRRLAWAAAALLAIGAALRLLTGGAAADVNGDGRVDILDAYVLALKVETSAAVRGRWDLSGDGRVDRKDAVEIARLAVQMAGHKQR